MAEKILGIYDYTRVLVQSYIYEMYSRRGDPALLYFKSIVVLVVGPSKIDLFFLTSSSTNLSWLLTHIKEVAYRPFSMSEGSLIRSMSIP
jgi:hypothetical protein